MEDSPTHQYILDLQFKLTLQGSFFKLLFLFFNPWDNGLQFNNLTMGHILQKQLFFFNHPFSTSKWCHFNYKWHHFAPVLDIKIEIMKLF